MRAANVLTRPAAAFLMAVVPVAAPSSARTISLHVTVETDGNLVTGLTEKNFRLYEDGEARPVRLQEPETPVTVALLVEYSQGSWFYFNDIFRSIEGFFSEAPEGNWYALATFSNELKIPVDFTKQKGKITNAFSELGQPMWDMINTYDALYQMIDKMGRLQGRRVLIFIGSGFDTFSQYTLDDVQKKLEASNVVVYALGAGSGLRGRYDPYLGTSTRMSLLQQKPS